MDKVQPAHTPSVAVIGSSLLLEGVAANLIDMPGVNVVCIEDAVDEYGNYLAGLWPELVIFELNQPGADQIFDRYAAHREPVLVGLDATNNRLVVINGTEQVAPSAADLYRIVLELISCPAP